MLSRSDAYFSYEDCNPDCIHYKACCTIQEITPDYFPSRCTDTEETCREVASPQVVCIRPDDIPLGGSEIWPKDDEWKHKHHHPSTTAKPTSKPTDKPDIVPNCKNWKLTTVIIVSVIALATIQKMLAYLIGYFRTRAYETIQPGPVPPIYERTTQDIEDAQSQ